MDIVVYSRRGIEAVRPQEVPHIVISITSADWDQARIPPSKHDRGILRLAFADAAVPSAAIAESSLFSEEQARSIWAFVLARVPDVERIVIHCDAGLSRSPAVAAAIAKRLNGDAGEFVVGRFQPNPRVLAILDATGF